MKKFLLLIITLWIICGVQLVKADSWEDLSSVEKMWDGQKSITNQEFEKVVEKLEAPQKQKEEKEKKAKRKKKFGSGTTLHEELNPDNKVLELESLKPENDLVISIPVDLLMDNNIIEKGFYKIVAEIDSETQKKYLNFYQSQYFKGKVEITETKSDFDEKELNFVKLVPYNDSFVQIIFGSLDFNGYVFLPYENTGKIEN